MPEHHAFAALEAGASQTPIKSQEQAPGPHEVAVLVSHCGICHSDLHKIDNDWPSPTHYPLVAGHEVIGEVKAVGSEVRDFKVGDRVGMGPQRKSCLTCEHCGKGDENLCAGFQDLYDPLFGGYSQHVVCDSRWVFHIPQGLPSEVAAPLLCAGVTVYAPLDHWGPVKGGSVAIVGIGGLGHLALQYAKAMGFVVTAISTSPDKEAEARSFGADHFISLNDAQQVAAAGRSFDLMLNTASGLCALEPLLNLLKPDGRLVLLGLPKEEVSFRAMKLVIGRRSLSGSIIGSTRQTRDMLEFSAKHNIRPKIEVVDVPWGNAAPFNEAIKKVRENKARYRMVVRYNSA
eukprot:TRINITY_DN19300_c0_g1_i1.p1 TRINITY_DN19300_c0_g1~~TRINITY_DN19300_c0_g1_i1.p1  ORF type:complete len:369 (+),score=87.28 TRINITY_DN19300_c0_g1_i1:75-1109(+)